MRRRLRNRPRRMRFTGSLLAVILLCLAGCREAPPEALPRPHLQAGLTFQAELAGGPPHAYPVELKEGDYLHLVVEQQGIDVVLRLSDPEGRLVEEVDRPTGARGPENLHYIGDVSGRHRLMIAPFKTDASAGSYEGRVVALRPARDSDRAVVEFERAERMRQSRDDQKRRVSLEHYGRALRIWESLDATENVASTARQMGLVALGLGEAERAIALLRRSLAGLQQTGDLSVQAKAHNDLGRAHDHLAQPEESFRQHQKALEVAKRAEDPYQQAVSLVLIAQRLSAGGRIEQALETFEEAISRWRAMGESSRLADTLTQAGRCYSLLGRMEESRHRLREALDIRGAEGNVRRQVTVLTEIGWNHYLEKDTLKAIEVLQHAVALSEAAGRRGPAGTLDRLGSAYRQAGRYEESLETYQQALSLLDDAPILWKANTWANLGELHRDWGQPAKALEYLRRAIPHFEENRDVHALAHALYVSGLARLDLGQLSQARRLFERMLKILDSVRFRVDRQAFLDALQTVYFRYYDAYVDLLMRLHERQPDEGFDLLALAASERTRALRLEQAWSVAPSGHSEASHAELERRRGWLQAKIQARDQERIRRINADAKPDEIALLDDEQNRLLLELDALESELRPRPKGAGEPLDLEQIQTRLGEDALLLYYALGASRSFLWRVDSKSVESFTLSPGAEIEKAARRCQRLLNRPPAPARALQASLYLQLLTRELLGPVIGGLDRQRLVVVPDAAIQYVPFAALGPRQRPLIVDHDVSYLPSAATLELLEKHSSERTGRYRSLAVFADPVFSPRDPRLADAATPANEPVTAVGADLARSARDLGYAHFDRLRHTRAEAGAISALFPREDRFQALGFEATRKRALEMDLSRFSILHFATHGMLHPRYPQLSGIVLSLLDEQGNPLGGFLRAHDIARLRLRADLVVLSACRTAMGREIPGEGVIGLPHSFMQAGVPGVVVSQWNVNDEATAHLMKRFYHHMVTAGKPPSAALCEAQRSMLKHDAWKNPYYWAAFVYYGKIHH